MTDIHDIPFFVTDLKNEMPLITHNDFSMPYSFSQGLPKNPQKEAIKINDKFLNKHLSTIEEIAKKFPDHKLPKWMRNYQNRIFNAYLGRDGFLKNPILADLSDIRNIGRQHNNEFISFGKILGATVTTGDASDNNVGTQANRFHGMNATVVNNVYYDQLALNIKTAAGNYVIAAYNDSGAYPSSLYASSNSIAASTGFNLQSITEFPTLSTTIWLAWNCDNGSFQAFRHSIAGGEVEVAETYTAPLPSTAPGSGTDQVAIYNMKVAHS